MLEREKLSRPKFNDWFRQLRIVLQVEKKFNVSETPITLASAADEPNEDLEAWNALYDLHNEVASGVELYELIYTFHACKQEGQSVSSYVLTMKSYLEQLEHLNYVLPQVVTVSLILNSLSKDFEGFMRNYNMHSIGKTISELHAIDRVV
ncbi:hypothetical protein Tco_1323725, partial [Tanacetum coccineum]